jgi:hypothetical protein
MVNIKIHDYTELTCTNLMIRLKILLKKLPSGDKLNFYSTREQFDNIKKPFTKYPYSFQGKKIEENKYNISISKNL